MYIIKTHYEPTEKNTNRAGDIHDWYSGKGGSHIGGAGKFPSDWEIEHYGFTSLAGAKKALREAQNAATWETRNGWWNVTAELIEC